MNTRFQRLNVLVIMVFVLQLGLKFAVAAPSLKKEVPWLMVTGACTDSEKWILNKTLAKNIRIPEELLEFYEKVPSSESSFLERYKRAVKLSKKLPQSQTKPYLQYWVWRSMLGLKLPTVARAGFSALMGEDFAARPSLRPIVQAALLCNVQIKKNYSNMSWSEAEKSVLFRFPAAVLKGAELESVTANRASVIFNSILGAKGLEAGSPQEKALNDSIARMGVLGNAGKVAQIFLQTIVLLEQGGEPYEKIKALELLLSEVYSKMGDDAFKKDSTHAYANWVDWAYLTLGRLYYEVGDFKRSIDNYEKVRVRSQWFDEAVLGQAWSALVDGVYDKAVGITIGLDAAGFQKKFAPENQIIAAMAYLEVCNYAESLQSLGTFEKNYKPVQSWLNQFTTGGDSAYQAITDYLKKKKTIPIQIMSAWVSSPSFERGQSQINSLIDERKVFKKVLSELSSESDPDIQKNFSTISDFSKREYPRFEKELLQKLDQDLRQQAQALLNRLNDLFDNSQFVEVEILNSASQNIIAKRMALKRAEDSGEGQVDAANSGGKKAKSAGGQVLGAFDATDGKGEIWNDEVGNFRAEITNQCPKVKKSKTKKAQGQM